MTIKPSAPSPAEALRDLVRDRLAGLPGLGIRAMFGGYGLYEEEHIFGVIAGRIYFKTDAETRPAYIAAGMQPWRESKHYYEVPPAVLADPETLIEYAKAAAAITAREKAARSAKAPRGRSAGRTRSK